MFKNKDQYLSDIETAEKNGNLNFKGRVDVYSLLEYPKFTPEEVIIFFKQLEGWGKTITELNMAHMKQSKDALFRILEAKPETVNTINLTSTFSNIFAIDNDPEDIKHFFSLISNIENLNISCNLFPWSGEIISEFFSTIQSTSLDLSNCELSLSPNFDFYYEDFHVIFSSFSKNIKEINLSGSLNLFNKNSFNVPFENICESLIYLKHIEKLILKQNKLSLLNLESLKTFLSCISANTIDLRENGFEKLETDRDRLIDIFLDSKKTILIEDSLKEEIENKAKKLVFLGITTVNQEPDEIKEENTLENYPASYYFHQSSTKPHHPLAESILLHGIFNFVSTPENNNTNQSNLFKKLR